MDDQLKQLLQELGNAINESLSESEAIARAIGKIKQAGYDVYLVLEATIGYNKRRPEGEEEETGSPTKNQKLLPSSAIDAENLPLTSKDMELMREMRITFKDPKNPPSGPKKK